MALEVVAIRRDGFDGDIDLVMEGLPEGVSAQGLKGLLRDSRMLDDILNRVPMRSAAYVGASAFAHKAGLHASAILKDPTTYEHVDPSVVGNERVIPFTNLDELTAFHCGFEQHLVATGWSLVEFGPERRSGQDRRSTPRNGQDRRRPWLKPGPA